MSQEYRIGKQTYRVRWSSGEEETWDLNIVEVREEGDEIEVARFSVGLSPIEKATYRLSVDGSNYIGYTASSAQGEEVFIGGESYLVVPPEKLSRRRAGRGQEAEQYVTPPMPGVVIKILAQVGERVEKGQGVLVISAMKMETTLASPKSGIVAKVNTKVDAQVKPGDVLIEVEEKDKPSS